MTQCSTPNPTTTAMTSSLRLTATRCWSTRHFPWAAPTATGSCFARFPDSLFPRRDPGVDPLLQHVHRKRARAEDLVVEGADVEAVAELAAGDHRAHTARPAPPPGGPGKA